MRNEKEFNVGDKVWWVVYERREVEKTCPICFGKLKVVLILGDGSKVQTDCTYCERGYQQYGYVTEYEYVSAIKLVAITNKEVLESEDGRNVEYKYNNYCLNEENAFSTKEEAEEKLKEVIKKQQEEDLKRIEYKKGQNPRSYSGHIGYYQKKKRDAIEEIEYADKKIKYFKENKELMSELISK